MSVIVPTRNEEVYIRECLGAIARQDYPREKIEVLVVDGMSTDGTRAIVGEFTTVNEHFRLIDNGHQDTISALNLGLTRARNEFIVRVDGHTVIREDYVSRSVEVFLRSGATCVGGAMRPIGKTFLQRVIAVAMRTPFGMGSGRFHYSELEEYVDTVYLGAFPKSIIELVGGFDPEMPYSEDNEFNYRIIQNGGKLLLSDRIVSWYYPRDTISSLCRQFFRYGFHKIKFFTKCGRVTSFRHIIPSLFVIGLVFCLGLAVFGWPHAALLIAVVTLYVAGAVLFGMRITRRPDHLAVLPIVSLAIHVSYGSGFLLGFAKHLTGGTRPAAQGS